MIWSAIVSAETNFSVWLTVFQRWPKKLQGEIMLQMGKKFIWNREGKLYDALQQRMSECTSEIAGGKKHEWHVKSKETIILIYAVW